jgi:hypothetical protein
MKETTALSKTSSNELCPEQDQSFSILILWGVIWVNIDGVWLVNGFTDHLYTQVITVPLLISTINKPQITTAPAKPFPAYVFTSRSLATAFNSGNSSASRSQVLSSQPPVQNCLPTDFFPLLITFRHGPRGNAPLPKVTLLLRADSLPRERVYRAVAQKWLLFTESPLRNGSTHHNIIPYLR